MEKKEEKKDEQLQEFSWDKTTDEDSTIFFGQKPVSTDEVVLTEEEKEKIKKEADAKAEEISKEEKLKKDDKTLDDKKKDDKTSDKKPEEEKKKEDEKVTFFNEEKPEEKKVVEDDDEFFSNLANGLKEQGVFTTVEIPEGNLSEEQFVQLQEDEIEARITETFEGFFEEMDEDGKAFLKFKKEGGKTSEFFDVMKSTSALPEGDITDEKYQQKVITYYSETVDEMDEDEIADRIEWLEEGGKTEKYAKKYEGKLKLVREAKKAALKKTNKDIIDNEDKIEKKFQKELKEKINSVESVKNIPITKDDKAELYSFITRPTVKIGKNKYITAFQDSLQRISNDYETMILLAKLVKSDFDFSQIEVKAETKQVRKLRETLERTKRNTKPTTSKGSAKKELSDFF